MKKHYLLTLLLLLSGVVGSAQLVANDDTVQNVNNVLTQFTVLNVLNNDTWNGGSISSSSFTVTVLTSSNPSITINQQGWISVMSGIPVGSYTLTYQVCQNSNPGNCATGTVTVSVCSLNAPLVSTGGCDDPNAITVYGLPGNGPWVLTQLYNNWQTSTITGSGSSYTPMGLPAGLYSFKVTSQEGCTSPYSASQYIGFLDGFYVNMTGYYVDSNGDGTVNLGDTVNYDFELTNVLDCDITDIYFSDGQIISGSLPIAVLPAWETAYFSGTYFITQEDINNGWVNAWAGISGTVNGMSTYTKAFTDSIELGIPSGFTFIAFVDDNGNGVKDPGEENFSNGYFTYSVNNGSNVFTAASGANDFTLYETDSNNTYDVTFSIYGSCDTAFTVTPSSYDDIFVSGAGFSTFYFAITANACVDTAIYISPLSNPRPNMPYSQQIVYVNYGTDPIASGTITFNADPLVTVVNVNDPGATMTSSGFTYPFTNLQPGEYRYINVTMDVPNVPTVNIDDILTNTATLSIPAGDINTANNTAVRNDIVTNSYDPNDITEAHGPKIVFSELDPNESLIYTVRFENTGNANAIDVVVWNWTHDLIDENSVRIISSSHPYLMERFNDNFFMTFKGIELPPSVEGTDIGKGYYTYEVKLKPGISVGDIILNDAEIFFDSNPGIWTNMWTTEFVNSLGTPQHSLAEASVYPNPSTGIVNVRSQSVIEAINITDVMGKSIMSREFNSDSVSIDISHFSNGMYFMSVQSGGETQTVRIVKQ